MSNLLSIKAFGATDDVHQTEDGKRVIFRNIQGRTVPIRVTSEEYLDWLTDQGIDLDTTDQQIIRDMDKHLIRMEELAEIGPEHQQAYEEQMKDHIIQTKERLELIHQMALDSRAARSGTTTDELRQDAAEKYKANQQAEVAREDMPDRGWGAYIETFTDRAIANGNVSIDSPDWHVIKAFDFVMSELIPSARAGIHTLDVNPTSVIDEILADPQKISATFQDRYKHLAKDQREQWLILGNMAEGLRNLKKHITGKTPLGVALSERVEGIYDKMVDDFSPKDTSSFSEFDPANLNDSDNVLTGDLPEEYSPQEAASLRALYDRATTKHVASHKVTLHVMARIFESIPESEHLRVAREIDKESSGLHAVHRAAFESTYNQVKNLNLPVDVNNTINELLRIGVSSVGGTTADKINTLKHMSGLMGTLDAALVINREPNLTINAFKKKWRESATLGNRDIGVSGGPNLVDNLLDDELRKFAKIGNSSLRVKPQKVSPQPEKTASPEVSVDLPENDSNLQPTGLAGFLINKKTSKLQSPEGYTIDFEDDSENWVVRAPDGRMVDVVEPLEDMAGASTEYREYMTSIARTVIEDDLKEKPDVTPSRAVLGMQDLSPEDTSLVEEIVHYYGTVGAKIESKNSQGSAYSVTMDDGNSFMFLKPEGKALQIFTSYKTVAEDGKEDVSMVPLEDKTVTGIENALGRKPNMIKGFRFAASS